MENGRFAFLSRLLGA